MVIFFVGDENMKLFLKRDTSADNGCFTVFDETGEEKYRVLALPSKLIAKQRFTVTDTSGAVAARIRRLPIVGTRTYVLKFGGRHVTFVMFSAAAGGHSYFYGSNWCVSGEIYTGNFSIIDVDKTLILEHRKHAAYRELLIPNRENELFCVAASVCANLINTVESPALQAV